jgi:hypothetical protein
VVACGLSHQPTSQSSSRDKDEPSQQWVVEEMKKGGKTKMPKIEHELHMRQ